MTSTDRLAELAAEALAEVARMGQRIAELESVNAQMAARITELEAIVTVGHGTMGTLQPDEPATITHGHAPSAPPHDE